MAIELTAAQVAVIKKRYEIKKKPKEGEQETITVAQFLDELSGRSKDAYDPVVLNLIATIEALQAEVTRLKLSRIGRRAKS